MIRRSNLGAEWTWITALTLFIFCGRTAAAGTFPFSTNFSRKTVLQA